MPLSTTRSILICDFCTFPCALFEYFVTGVIRSTALNDMTLDSHKLLSHCLKIPFHITVVIRFDSVTLFVSLVDKCVKLVPKRNTEHYVHYAIVK